MDADLIHNQQTREAMMLVGGYLLTWGQLETALASGFHNIAPNRRGPHIDPKDVSKTLSHLAKEWGKEVKKAAPSSTKMVDELVQTIIDAAGDRNTICHGWQGVFTHLDGTEWQLACWHKFHETRSTGAFPKQRIYEKSLLEGMIHETETFRKRVMGLTEFAQIEQEKTRAREGS